MQDGNENRVKKVGNKRGTTNVKMSKNQKSPQNQQNISESPQNVRVDTSESDEESVSEESFPQDNDEISTEDFPDDEESCDSDQEEDVTEEDSEDENTDDDSDNTADEAHQSGPAKKFLLNIDEDQQMSKQTRIESILEAAAASKDKRGNPVLRNATAALDEAAQTITRMRSQDASPRDKNLLSRTLIAACTDNDVNAVRRLLVEGNNLNDTDDGDSLLSLACSAGYYELAQVLLAMSAQVEDRGQKNDCTPLMEAASAGHVEIIELLIRHGADVNAQSSTGNTPLMYACAGGHVEAVKVLLAHGANVEDHNENGHTPLMESASAGHVEVAKILLEHGAGINTHSNEFKESALTLACYKGHLDMVRFLLEAGADQEHKTDEMHTALMEASMDGHVEVARLLLDSGAQVNMPTDSFESPLTLAACGGHVDLAMLLIERGANIEEVNDEGYTPLMEAAREGHEEMVSLLLTQGANINAQTEETQETALTLACCGGFLEVADYLIKHGADIELGASTPLMEAAQEGHLELVKFLLENKADVHAQTQTGDTALTYACENGHTDVGEILLYYGAELEHLSEGGRTPLMKACRAGHICTVKFLIQKGADVNRQTTNNDHTPLSLACAGGHQQVVELLLAHGADPYHKLKDNSTMLIEAAKGGHTGVVQLLLDYPTSIPPQPSVYIPATMPHQASQMNISQIKQQQLKILQQQQQFMVTPPGLHEVTEVIRLQDPPGMFQSQTEMMQNQNYIIDQNLMSQVSADSSMLSQMKLLQSTGFKDGLAYGLTKGQNAVSSIINQQSGNNINVVPCNNQQPPLITNNLCMAATSSTNKQKNISRKKSSSGSYNDVQAAGTVEIRPTNSEQEDNVSYIKSSLDKLDNTLQKNIQFIHDSGPPSTLLPSGTYVDITTAAQGKSINLTSNNQVQNNTNNNSSSNNNNAVPTAKPTQLATKSEVSQATAISDRPKVKAKNSRKNQQQIQQSQSGQKSSSQTPAVKSEPESTDQAASKANSSTAVPQAIQEASMTSYQPSLLIDDGKESKFSTFEKNHAFSLVDFEAFQKMPLNNLSNRSAHWDPKVFRKIAQLIDPPKTPNETPPGSQSNSRPNSPEEKKLENEFKSLIEEAMHNGMRDKHEEALASIHQLNPEEFAGCGNAYPSLEAIESFNTEDVAISSDDATGPIYNNYEWVDEIMQTLNVSPDISNAFHEIAANINNQEFEQYANIFGLNSICKSKWSTPHWPTHQISSQSASPTNEQDENMILQNEGEPMEGKPDDQNLLMIDQTGYTPQFTVEQLQLLSQLQQQHPLLQIDPQTAQNILMPSGSAGFQMSPTSLLASQQQQQKSAVDTQQTKFVFNVDGEKTSQSLQLLFQLPNDGSQQPVKQQQQQANLNQKVQQNVAQTQTMPIAANSSQPQPQQQQQQPIQLPQMLNHQQSFLNFQLQQQQQQQAEMQNAISTMQQQKVQPTLNKANYQQVATQTQIVGTQSIDMQPHQQQQQAPVATTGVKTNNVQANVCSNSGKKPNISNDQKRKEKSRYAMRQASASQNQFQYDQQLQYANIPNSTSGTPADRSIEIDSETDSNHDTALTLACAGGHEELVELLLSRKANIEHRDKKGFTPLILAATAGHEKVVETLINNGADLEAQSERTKDTPLSLACSGGRYEVVELLLRFGANKEHRNVSDYTPLSLAASGGYVNIIKLLLNHGAEINSRTGSKLGISPLMLAAMNGHTAAVRLLLDMGSDINAQIETNRNTALTLACFQGRHEVVSLLLDRKANVEHRAKTGLTPLMEAASGGYIEVGRVLLDKGADVNAAPVPSSRDTALTIAADKGHLKFVELLLARNAAVEVKNKKGNSPLWLAANGGHLGVVESLYHAKADIDSQDNRKVSCLMAAFRKGHVKVVKWMVNHVSQFPSDQEMTRYISVVDKEVVDKCHECVKVIRAAKETQAAKANINASILLKELDMEKSREDARKAAAAKRRERKKRRKQEKREAQRKANGEPSTNVQVKNNSSNQKNNKNNSNNNNKPEESDESEEEEDSNDEENENDLVPEKEEGGDSGIDQGSCSSSTEAKAHNILPVHQEEPEDQQQLSKNAQKNKNRNKNNNNNNKNQQESTSKATAATNFNNKLSNRSNSPPPHVPVSSSTTTKPSDMSSNSNNTRNASYIDSKKNQKNQQKAHSETLKPSEKENVPINTSTKGRESNKNNAETRNQHKKSLVFGNSRSSDDYDVDFPKPTTFSQSKSNNNTSKSTTSPSKPTSSSTYSSASKSQFKGGEDEWKEVGRKPTTTASNAPSSNPTSEMGYKKIQVPLNAISRVIGRQGSNINAIRAATGAHIEVEKQGKTQGDRSITIKGVPEATKQAHNLISALVKDPDADILSMLPRNNFQPVRSSSSTNIISPSTAINNGTSVWEKSLNTIPTVSNPVKPASYAAPLKSTGTPPIVLKSTTPTQIGKSQISTSTSSSQQRSNVAKNLFTASNIIRPTPTSSNAKILMQDGAKKGIIASIGPPSKPASSANATFASKLNSSGDATGNAEKKAPSINQSPMKQIFNPATSSLPTAFSNTSNVSSTDSTNVQIQQSQSNVTSGTSSNMTRSITPIGPLTRNTNASPHTSHIVNTLDLSTPYNNPIASSHHNPVVNDLTTQIQSKLSELHVSAQGLEYSLFDNCKNAWPQEQPVAFHEQLSAPFIEPPAPIFDASKAPGYRGNASINSPVSSKTSSNSATPPSTVLATQASTNAASNTSQSSGGTFGDINTGIKPIGPVSRPTNMMSSNSNTYGRSAAFDRFISNESYGNMNYMNPASMSRLNPKASAFSASNLQSKMNSNQYDSATASSSSSVGSNAVSNSSSNINNNNSNNNNYMKSPGSSGGASSMSGHQNYHRTSMNNPASRWLGDLGHSFVGQNMDYGMATGSSPNMSPNNNSMNGPNNNNNNNSSSTSNPANIMDDSRKAPRPIGTERHNFKYNFQYPMSQAPPPSSNVMDLDSAMLNQIGPNSWLDKSNPHQWQAQSNVAVIRNPYETQATDYLMPDLFQQQYSMDQQMNYARNGQGPNHPYHTSYMNDLSNLTADLQQSSYEKQQPWAAKWTH